MAMWIVGTAGIFNPLNRGDGGGMADRGFTDCREAVTTRGDGPLMKIASQHDPRWSLAPVTTLGLALAFGLAVMAGVLALALQQPWLGLKFAAGEDGAITVARSGGPGKAVPVGTIVVKIQSGANAMALEALDLTIEPDGVIADYQTYRRFIARQDRLAEIQRAPELSLITREGRKFTVVPDPDGRPLSAMPVDFWVGLVVGLAAWLVSAAVFAFRPGDAAARYLLLSGAATLMFAPAAVIYTTRELAVDGMVFRWASDLNFFGGSLFAASFVALLLHYPRRLAPGWVGIGVVLLYVIWFVAQQLDVFESKIFARRFLVMIGVGATFVLAGVHWMGTRRDPVGRAALQWFLLSWVLGTGLFALFILLPQTFGVDTTPLQGYAFLLFLLVYGGLAFGILRYRLFDLGEWWRRIVVWTLSVLLLVLLDLFFLFGLHFSTGASLALSLLIAGVFWLPFRAWVWSRLAARRETRLGNVFSRVMDIALAPAGSGCRERLWQELLGAVFDPLNVAAVEVGVAAAAIERDGLHLCLPGVGTIPALRLEYARGGRGLFTPRDAALAMEMVTMLDHGIQSRSAYGQGVEEERVRMARDIHDNIGAQLLAALHSRNVAVKDAKIREALGDLRNVINNSAAANLSIDETLAELRLETADLLAAAGLELEWTSDEGDSPLGNAAVTHALRSIIRETVSNVIRHSGASRVGISVRSEGGWLMVEIADDGVGFEPEAVRDGHGVSNIRARVQALDGSLEMVRSHPGMRLALRIPVDR
jgi:two-component system, NarL family, sensor histidine kinase DevS